VSIKKKEAKQKRSQMSDLEGRYSKWCNIAISKKNMQIGVDKGLIEMFLKMTPEERLRANDNTIRALIELRNAFKKRKTSGLRSKRSA